MLLILVNYLSLFQYALGMLCYFLHLLHGGKTCSFIFSVSVLAERCRKYQLEDSLSRDTKDSNCCLKLINN